MGYHEVGTGRSLSGFKRGNTRRAWSRLGDTYDPATNPSFDYSALPSTSAGTWLDNLFGGSSNEVPLSPLNAVTGTLTPTQVAAIQSGSVAQNNQVLQNAVAAYGPGSPPVLAIQGVLPAQNAATLANISALNPSTDPLLAATGIPWYLWAVGAAIGLWVATR